MPSARPQQEEQHEYVAPSTTIDFRCEMKLCLYACVPFHKSQTNVVTALSCSAVPLLNVLGTQIKASEPTPYTTLWAQLTGVTLLRDDYSE